jgi:hypothetical protein
VILDIADAVVDSLNSGSFALSFIAVRYYVPVGQLEALETLTVQVVPTTIERLLQTRAGGSLDTYRIDVGIMQVIGTGPMDPLQIETACDPLMGLVEAIANSFFGQRLASYPQASCIEVANAPIYSPPHLDGSRLFLSLLTLGFRVSW